MTDEVYRLISRSAILSTLVPLISLFVYRKAQPRQNVILGVSLAISFAFDVIGFALARIYHTNVLSNNLYFIVAFPAVMWFYHETLVKKSLRIVVRIFTIAFFILSAIFVFDQGLTTEINQNILTLSSILISITSLFFVVDLNFMDQSNFTKNRFHETNILLNTSLAIYYFFTIVLFPIWNTVEDTLASEDALYIYAAHNFLHIFKNIGIAIAFYLTAKRYSTSSNVYP